MTDPTVFDADPFLVGTRVTITGGPIIAGAGAQGVVTENDNTAPEGAPSNAFCLVIHCDDGQDRRVYTAWCKV